MSPEKFLEYFIIDSPFELSNCTTNLKDFVFYNVYVLRTVIGSSIIQ